MVLNVLPEEQQQQLARLTVFPSTFNEEDAEAVLGCLPGQALSQLHVLRGHSLLLYDSTCGQHFLHTAVKQQVVELATAGDQLQPARGAFIRLMLARLTGWAAMHRTKASTLALRLLRQQAANVDELWRVVSEYDLQQGTMAQVAAAMTDDLRLLLVAGQKFTAAAQVWHRLERWAAEHCANTLTYAAFANPDAVVKEAKLRTALDVRLRVLGPNHADTITSHDHLAKHLGQHTAGAPMLQTMLGPAAGAGVVKRSVWARIKVVATSCLSPAQAATISSCCGGQPQSAGGGPAGQPPAPDVGAGGQPPAPDVLADGQQPAAEVGVDGQPPAPDVLADGQPPVADMGSIGQPSAAGAAVADELPAAGAGAAGPQMPEFGAHPRLDQLGANRGQLTELCRQSLDAGVRFLRQLGPQLPVPGPSAAELLATVLDHCSKALANQDNLMRLVERCTDLLGLLAGRLEPAATGAGLASTQEYRRLMGKFCDVLQGVEAYCQTYTRKAWWLRAISTVADQEMYDGLVKRLIELTEDALPERHRVAHQLGAQLAYAVNQDLEKAVETVASIMRKGPHQLIKQLELRELWFRCFAGQERVSWQLWWRCFPKYMEDWLAHDEYQQLCTLLDSPDAMSRFQAAVGTDDDQYISVHEVMRTFPADTELVPRVLQLLQVEADSSGPARCSLPALDPLYCGREADASHVCSLLTSNTSPVRAVLLLGGGGLGKSSLAVDVGWQLWRAGLLPGGVAVVNLRDATTEAQQLQRFCIVLNVQHDDYALHRLLAKLGSLPADHPLLLVLDNAEDCLVGASAATFTQLVAKVLCSSPAVKLLITSRVAWPTARSASLSVDPTGEQLSAFAVEALPDYQQYQVPPMDQAVLAQLLRQRCPEDVLPPAQLQPVLHTCGGSPLLTRLVADALSNGRLVPEDVIAAVGSQGADAAAAQLVLTSLPKQQQQQLAQLTVFPYTFNEEDAAAIFNCPPSQALALLHVLHAHSLLLHDSMCQQHYLHAAVRQHAAVLAGEQLLQSTCEAFIHLMLVRLTDWAAMYQTKDWALALRLLRQQAGNVDKLWRRVSECNRQQGTMEQVAAALTNDLRLLLLAGHNIAAGTAWRTLQQCTFSKEAPHANALTFAAYADGLHTKEAESKLRTALEVRQRVLGPEHPDTISSINNLATCLQAIGQCTAAEPLYRTALEVRQRVLGPKHPDTISSSNNLAFCLQAIGQYTAAEPLYRTALEVRQRVLGPEHPDTISSISNLATCLQAMGQYTAAEPLHRTALEVRQRVLGPEHPDTISSISNLATCLQDMGQYAAAEPMLRTALEVRQRVLGPEHPYTISSSNNLASCLQAMGQYTAAEPMYRTALEVRQRVLGLEHPDTISSINALANCHLRMGQYAAAEPMYRTALEVRQRVLGPEHPDTITSSNNLASCLFAMGQYAAAEPMYRTALEVRQRVLGSEHPATISSINNLAVCFHCMGQYAAAEPLYRTAQEARQRVLGPEHPDTLDSISTLASCLQAMGQYAAAEPMFRSVLQEQRRLLGVEHPGTITSISNLAKCLQAMGQYAAVEPMFRTALEALQRVLGPEHPSTIRSVNYLAGWLQAMGQYAAAEPLYRTALEVQQRVLGPEHPDTATGTNDLASCLQAMGQCAAAEPMFRTALEVRQRVLGPEHPGTISSNNNLAKCLQAMGQYAAAEPMLRSAVALRQRVLGPEHPDTMSSVNNLASCLQAMGQLTAAEPLYRTALEVRQRILGPEHPDTAGSINDLAGSLQAMGQYAAAEPLFRMALEVRQRVLGLEHPDTISSKESLAKCLEAMGQQAALA